MAVDLTDKPAKHLLRVVEIGDDAVLERTYRYDVPRSPAEHSLCLFADSQDFAGLRLDSYD
jgi:hypothetical protein